MCAPFWWSSLGPGAPPTICGNGTICFINTGERHIGVTADHVCASYLTDKRNRPKVECQFGSNTIDPEARLIERSELLDLATFDVPEVFVSAGDHYFHNAAKWPPKAVVHGAVVVHGGFPQILRVPKTAKVTFPFQWFATRVNAVDAKRIVLVPEGTRGRHRLAPLRARHRRHLPAAALARRARDERRARRPRPSCSRRPPSAVVAAAGADAYLPIRGLRHRG